MRLYFSDREALREAAQWLGWSMNVSGRSVVADLALAAVEEVLDTGRSWHRARVKRRMAALRSAIAHIDGFALL